MWCANPSPFQTVWSFADNRRDMNMKQVQATHPAHIQWKVSPPAQPDNITTEDWHSARSVSTSHSIHTYVLTTNPQHLHATQFSTRHSRHTCTGLSVKTCVGQSGSSLYTVASIIHHVRGLHKRRHPPLATGPVHTPQFPGCSLKPFLKGCT